jgi:hypothetical protein
MVQAQTYGRASAAALASARSKETQMRGEQGPESVTLTADEMASLVEANLDQQARRALDSIRIKLDPGRLGLHAVIVTSVVGTDILGPMAMMLNPTEPLAVAGPAHAAKAGLITWEPDSVVIRSFAFPHSAIPQLVSRLTGTTDGTIPIAVPPTVRRIFITPSGVTFSRKGA